MCTGFPRLGVLQRLRPIHDHRLASHLSTHRFPGWEPLMETVTDGSHVRLLSGQRVRHPALPLRYRHGYAVDIHHGLLAPASNTEPGVPHSTCGVGAHRIPAQIRRVRAGVASRGVTAPVPRVYLPVLLTGPDPSGSTESARLRRGCSHPPQRLPGMAASSFGPTATTAGRRRSLTSVRTTRASWRTARSDSEGPNNAAPSVRLDDGLTGQGATTSTGDRTPIFSPERAPHQGKQD